MKKEKYDPAELEVIKFRIEDVIMISPLEEDELPIK